MIPCALIGLGRIASLLEDDARREKPATHAGAVDAHPETFIAAGMDKDPERRRVFAERWGVEALYDDARRMIEAVRPRILHICTHADSHLQYLDLALRHQVPVVVLEKPVSDSLRKARRMVPRLAAGATRVVVNHERRYSRDYLKARDCIRSGRFGPLLSVTAGLYMGRERPLEAILLYDGTHLFDIITFLIGGPIEHLRRAGGREHSLYVTGRCAGIPVLAEIGNGRDHVVFELELSFESGRLRIGNGTYEKWESVDSPYYENMRSLRLIESPPLGKTGYFARMFADAVRLTKDPEATAVSSYADGLESLKLVQRIRKGLRF